MGDGRGAGRASRRGFPTFDGTPRIDDAARRAAADDFGHIVQRRPLAVLGPGSVDDVVRLIGFARRHGIGVAARGQGHSADGQSQLDAGVVIDMSALASVHDVGQSSADVDAGATW